MLVTEVMVCAICGAQTDGQGPTCPHCNRNVCPNCFAIPPGTEDEDDPGVCRDCFRGSTQNK